MWRPTREKGDKGYLGRGSKVTYWSFCGGILTPSLSLSCIFKGEKGICAVHQSKVSSAHKISEEKHWNTTGYPSADLLHLLVLILIEGLCLTNWFCSLPKKQGSESFHIFALGRHHCDVAFLWECLCRLISLTKQRNGTRSLVAASALTLPKPASTSKHSAAVNLLFGAGAATYSTYFQGFPLPWNSKLTLLPM